VASYFADLTHESSQLSVSRLDQAVEPARAHELGVSGNGVIVVTRDKRREQIPMPVKLESARSKLRTLDQDVYKRLVTVSRGTRVAYFVQGTRSEPSATSARLTTAPPCACCAISCPNWASNPKS